MYLVSGGGASEEVGAGVAGLHSAVELSEFNGELVQLVVDCADIVVEGELLHSLLVFLSLELVGELGGDGQRREITVEVAFLRGGAFTKYFLGSS
jgi:hypothetical protein